MNTITKLVTAAGSCLAVVCLTAPAQAGQAAAGVEGNWQMNEAKGTKVMTDTSGNGLNGTVDPAGVTAGVTFNGAKGYQWAFRSPTAPPAAPERVVQVKDSAHLDPMGDTFTVEIRYRTDKSFGNIIQKGQSASDGGQWKVQAPGGKPSCLFKGTAGQVATQVPTSLADNAWHVLTCVRTPTSVTAYVDGVQKSRKNGSAGVIDNAVPMTIGGKLNCDQVKVTCDYFTGSIDYVKITRG